MKRITISIFLMAISSLCFAQININELMNIDGKWHKIGESKAYSGNFIETNDKGDTVGTGTFVKGFVDGLRIKYYDNGNKHLERYYKNGVMHGMTKEYYENGSLKQECNMTNGENDGTATVYYDTGEKYVELNFENGVQQGDYFEYAKDGSLMKQFWFKDGIVGYSPEFQQLNKEALSLAREFKNKEAILKYDKAISLNPTVAQTYFNRGTTKSNMFDYENAIADYNKAIALNPNYMEAYVNRANAKINKYTSKGILEPSKEQLDGACEDLDKALQLGANRVLIEDMKCGHCD